MGAQPSSAIRSPAKLKTIENADEKEAQRGASSLICKPPRIGTATWASCSGRVRANLNRCNNLQHRYEPDLRSTKSDSEEDPISSEGRSVACLGQQPRRR